MKKINDIHTPVQRPERVLQFGAGNFLRAFTDWMIDIANEKTTFNGNVVMVQSIGRGTADTINRQNGLYTTILRGIRDGKTVEERRLINSVSRCINLHDNHDDYMRCAENPDLRFIFSNTTEAGIVWHEEDKLEYSPQPSFPGKVTAFLLHRYHHFKGDGTKGLVFIPCELIEKNGEKLKEYVVRHAKKWNLDAGFLDWIDAHCHFCNSLVDRIVPGYPGEEAEELCASIGYEDNLLDAAEIFHLLVIESKNDFSSELPLREAGLNVIWTDDLDFYRTRKVRILNGAHTMSVPAAFLYGLMTVEDCLNDQLLKRFMYKGIFEEIIPSMEGDSADLRQYAEDVLERFSNPYIKHLLISITLNSVSKFKTRVLPSLITSIARNGTIPPVLAFSLAALIAFYEGTLDENGEMTGVRNNTPYTIKDDASVLARFAELYGGDLETRADRLAHAVLSETSWWGEDLTAYNGLEEAVRSGLESIWSLGMQASIEALCREQP